jgi:hypothetical protein
MDRTCNSGTLASGWGSGLVISQRAASDVLTPVVHSTANFPYLTTPLSAITARAQLDNTKISSYTLDSDILGAAYATAQGKSAAIVFITVRPAPPLIHKCAHCGFPGRQWRGILYCGRQRRRCLPPLSAEWISVLTCSQIAMTWRPGTTGRLSYKR